MNKKQLAKLLIKHPEIKALYESREFDASIINKIVAEEIMREGEDDESYLDQVKATLEEYQQLKDEIEVNRPIIKKLEGSRTLNDEEIEDLEESKKILKEAEAELKKRKQDFIQVFTDASTIVTQQWTKGTQKEKDSKSRIPKTEKIPANRIKQIEPIISKAKNALEELSSEQPAEKRIEGGSSESPPVKKEDPAKKELIQSMQSEIEILKTLLLDPNEMPLDKEGYKEEIDEYTKNLEAMGVAVATTSSIEDDKAFVQSIQNEKPKIQKAAAAVKAAKGDDDFTATFPDLEAAIMAALKGSKDAATAANPELDLLDIEIDDVEEPVVEEPPTITLGSNVNKLQQLANAIKKLNPKQEQALATVIQKELDKAKVNSIDWQDLPQELLNIDQTLSMFNPIEDGGLSLKPEVSNIIPISSETGEVQKFEISKDELKGEEVKSQFEEIEANAEELTNKVEKKKMSDPTDVDYGGPFRGAVNRNGENPEVVVTEAERRLGIYENATDWSDSDLITLHPSIEKKESSLPDFELWKEKAENYMDKKVKEFKEKVKALEAAKQTNNAQAAQEAEKDLEQTIEDADKGNEALEAAINSDAAVDTQTGGDSGTGPESTNTDQATIEMVLSKLGSNVGTFPTLLANEPFSQLLMLSINAASDVVSNDSPEVTDTKTKTNSQNNEIPNLQEALSGIYLTEEDKEPTADNDSDGTKPSMSVEDAIKLRAEIQKMQELFKTSENENINTINVMDLAKQAFGEIPDSSTEPTAEQAAEQGANDAKQDEAQPDLKLEEAYKGYKSILDGFFSVESTDGFMDQFLLKHQSAMLSNMIGTLYKISQGVVDDKSTGEKAAITDKIDQTTAGTLQESVLNEGFFAKKEEKIQLKTRLVSLMRALKSLRALIVSYKDNMTRSSMNPKLDGSALKKSLMSFMQRLQVDIKVVIEMCIIERSKQNVIQTDELNVSPATDNTNDVESQQESIIREVFEILSKTGLNEEVDRDQKISIVRTNYNLMSEIYTTALSNSLESNDKGDAMTNAKQILEIAKKEDFLSMFPSFVSTKGRPQTIDDALDAVGGILKDFIKTMRKVITLAKGETLEPTTLISVINDLGQLSLTMQNFFDVKSQLPPDLERDVEKLLAQRKENQAVTDAAKPSNERESGTDTAEQGLVNIERLFDWMSAAAQSAWKKLFPGDDKIAPAISAAKLELDEEKEVIDQILDTRSWYETIEPLEKQAISNFIEKLRDVRIQSGLKEDIAVPLKFKQLSWGVSALSGGVLDPESIDADIVSAIEDLDDPAEINAILNLMEKKPQEVANYISTAFKLEKLVGPVVMKPYLDSSTTEKPNPTDGTSTADDQNNNSESSESELTKSITDAVKEAVKAGDDQQSILNASKAYIRHLIEKWKKNTGSSGFETPPELNEQETMGDDAIEKAISGESFYLDSKKEYDLLTRPLLEALDEIFRNFMKAHNEKRGQENDEKSKLTELGQEFTYALRATETMFATQLENFGNQFYEEEEGSQKPKAFSKMLISSIYLAIKEEGNPEQTNHENDKQVQQEAQTRDSRLFVVHFANGIKNYLNKQSGSHTVRDLNSFHKHIQTFLGHAINEFSSVIGNGPAKAKELITDGATATVDYEKFKNVFDNIIKSAIKLYKDQNVLTFDDEADTTTPQQPTIPPSTDESLERSLKPIIEKMLKEHYNY